MADLQKLTAMADKQANDRHSLIVKLVKALLSLWSGFDYPDNPTVVAGTAAKSAMLVASATSQTRKLQRSYLTSMFREMGVSTNDLPVSLDAYPRTTADPLEVYQRPVGQYVWQRRNDAPLEDQRNALNDYVTTLAETDVMVAERDEASRVYESREQITGYRRVIHPELSKSGTCGLCIVASNRFYHRGDLLPIHDGDNCTTMGVTKSYDPGLRLNADDLQTIYAAAGSTAAEDLINTRITIHEHGELGPVLVKQGDHFRTAEEAGRPAYVKPTPQSVAAAVTRNLASANTAIGSAQSAYDAFVSAHPESVVPNSTSPFAVERVAMFRAVKNLTDYQTALTAKAKQLAS